MTARLPVTVSSVQTWFYIYAYVKKSSPGSTQLPTSRHLLSPSQPLIVTSVTHTHIHTYIHTRINRLWSPLAYGLGGNNCFSFLTSLFLFLFVLCVFFLDPFPLSPSPTSLSLSLSLSLYLSLFPSLPLPSLSLGHASFTFFFCK